MELQQRIDEVAWSLFTQRGYSGVKMDDIAAELGISKKTLYTEIASKDALLARLIRAKLADAETQTADIIHAPDASAYDKLRGLLGYALSQLGVIQPVFLLDIRRNLPELWAEIEAAREHIIHERVGKVLREGIEHGEFRVDLDPTLVVTVVFQSLRGVITGNMHIGNPLQFAQLMETTINLLYEGLKERND